MLRVMFWSEVILTQLKCADEVNHNEEPYVDIIGGHLKVHENNSFKIRFLKKQLPSANSFRDLHPRSRRSHRVCIY